MSEPSASSIEEIIAELQAEVSRYQSEAPAGHRASHEPYLRGESGSDPLARVRLYQHVNSHLPIGWPDMPPGLLPRLRAYAQKIIRRLLRWYINPLVDQQNLFNTAVTEALAGISLHLERQEKLLHEMQGKVEQAEQSRRKVGEG